MSAPEELARAARAWALDCSWREDPEDIADLSDAAVLRGVNHYYEGGLRQCAEDALLDEATVAWAAAFDAQRAEGRVR